MELQLLDLIRPPRRQAGERASENNLKIGIRHMPIELG